MTSFSHSLGLTSCALQVASSEQMTAVFFRGFMIPAEEEILS